MRLNGLMAVVLLALAGAAPGQDVARLHWAGPPGSRPGTYPEWIAAHPARPLQFTLKSFGSGQDLVAVAVVTEASLAGVLVPELDQLTTNLQSRGCAVLRYTVSGGTPAELRSLLRAAHDSAGIEGALLIGALPVPWFQIKNDYGTDGYREWPIDLFYMDLDGVWLDSLRYDPVDTLVPGQDGIYDKHRGDVAPEIYVGRLFPNGVGDSVDLLRNYFRKDNAFRHDTLRLPARALVFVDDDWAGWGPSWSQDVGLAYPDRSNYFDNELTRAAVYRPRLDSARAWVSVFDHASSRLQMFYFDNRQQHDYYYAPEYTTQNPPANFYNFFACSFGRYTDTGYGGGRAIFNPGHGLGAIASTKTGSMLTFGEFYRPLGQAKSLGAAFKDWFTYVAGGGFSASEIYWHYGMTLLGDPFLAPLKDIDVGVSAILSPPTQIELDSGATPQARVLNSGTEPATAVAILRVGATYRDTQLLGTIEPQNYAVATFRPWTADQTGNLPVRCSVRTAGDRNAANNGLARSTLVYAPDAAVLRIFTPDPVVDTWPLYPKAEVANLSTASYPIKFSFDVRDSLDSLVYHSTLWLATVRPDTPVSVRMARWAGHHAPGPYKAIAWTTMSSDRHPGNDTCRFDFRVAAGVLGSWTRKNDVPMGEKQRRVKAGGCLAYGQNGKLYALKGSGTCEFYEYDPATNIWASGCSIPAVGWSGKKQTVKAGAVLTGLEGRLYAAKGGKSTDMWEYAPDSASWRQIVGFPVGEKAMKGGTGMTGLRLGDSLWLFMLKGGTQEFWRYSFDRYVWERDSDAPAGFSGKPFKRGSCLTRDADGIIYALKGATNEFYAFDAGTHVWSELPSLPLIGQSGHKRKARDGTGMCGLRDRLYAVKGGSNEFWAYDIVGRSWFETESLPAGARRKRVGAGGALAMADDLGIVFALRGGNTDEFLANGWSGLARQPAPGSGPQTEVSSGLMSSVLKLDVQPNPVTQAAVVSYSVSGNRPATLRLYDIAGKLITTLAVGESNAGSSVLTLQRATLTAGIYLLRLEAGSANITRKLIVE